MKRNVAHVERLASVAAGAGLLYLAARRPQRAGVARLAGMGLLARGTAGYCPVNLALHRGQSRQDTRQALGGSSGVHVRESVTIMQPVDEVFRFWRDLTALPKFMRHLERVEQRPDNRTHWVARGPGGTKVEWDAELLNQVDNELIAWRSLPGSDVVSAGSVNFRPAPNGGTELRVHLQYSPPAGRAGAWVAALLGTNPESQIREDLRRVKQLLETGEIATTQGQPAGRRRWRLLTRRRA